MDETFEAVVVGSGFGGTILALSFANKFENDNTMNNTDEKVCILERGQWWLSHEMNFTPKSGRTTFPNMRKFITSGRTQTTHLASWNSYQPTERSPRKGFSTIRSWVKYIQYRQAVWVAVLWFILM
jgi:choline dehydrogenase-like flavoprotein